ncbi:MAG: protein kinase [Planctomycetota bacterium]
MNDHDGTMAPGSAAGLSDAAAELPTKKIGPYLLIREIGRGAMGAVFEAEHESLRRRVAVKILPPELSASPEVTARFEREMHAIGRLEHPNIVLATDAGRADGTCYIAMQLLQGIDVERVLQQLGKLPIGAACEIIRQVALALQEIDSHGMVHRDIKPSNLLLDQTGCVKVLDLGIASLARGSTQDPSLTAPGGCLGTPDYIAPEMITQKDPIDIRADLYSLGCTLFHLISGQAPFSGDSYSSFATKLIGHTERDPEPLSQFRSEVPAPVCKIVAKMMQKSPQDRFANPAELVSAIEPHCDRDTLAEIALDAKRPDHVWQDPSIHRSATFGTRKVAALLVALVVAGIAIDLTLFHDWGTRSADQQAASNSIATDTPVVDASPDLSPVADEESNVDPLVDESNTTANVRTVAEDGKTATPAESPDPSPEPTNTESPTTEIEGSSETASSPTLSNALVPVTLEQTKALSQVADAIESMDATTRDLTTSAKSIDQSNQQIAENTSQIALTLQQMQQRFKQLASQPVEPVSEPDSPIQWYAKALQYAQSGNQLQAREAFLQFFQAGLNVVDPHLKFVSLLRLREGAAGARETYESVPGDPQLPARQLAAATLMPTPRRIAALKEILAKHPDFAPAHDALAKVHAQHEPATLTSSLAEKKHLLALIDAHQAGNLLCYFLDQSKAEEMLSDARSRLQQLDNVRQELVDHPIEMTAHYELSKPEWWVSLQIAEDATEPAFRTHSESDFRPAPLPAGQGDRPTRYLRLTLPPDTVKTSIEFKYVDAAGHSRGPFAIPFDPKLIRAQYAIDLIRQEKGREDWIDISGNEIWFNGLLLFGRQAINEIKYGVNVDRPDRAFPVPQVDYSAQSQKQYYTTVSGPVRFVTMQLTTIDGKTSPIYRYEP